MAIGLGRPGLFAAVTDADCMALVAEQRLASRQPQYRQFKELEVGSVWTCSWRRSLAESGARSVPAHVGTPRMLGCSESARAWRPRESPASLSLARCALPPVRRTCSRVWPAVAGDTTSSGGELASSNWTNSDAAFRSAQWDGMLRTAAEPPPAGGSRSRSPDMVRTSLRHWRSKPTFGFV